MKKIKIAPKVRVLTAIEEHFNSFATVRLSQAQRKAINRYAAELSLSIKKTWFPLINFNKVNKRERAYFWYEVNPPNKKRNTITRIREDFLREINYILFKDRNL